MPPATRKTDLCISKDTLIPLLDGRNIPISELNINENIYTYSLDLRTKEIVPGKIRKVFKTGTFECLRIWFDNGQYLDCTEDHEIINRSGSYVPASKLKINDSLMPLYRTVNDVGTYGYESIWNPALQNYQETAKMVYKWKYGNSFFGKNMIVSHHKDFNSRNNNPENILAVNTKRHWNYHVLKKSKQMKLLAKKGLHIFQNTKVIENTRKRMINNNPMKYKEIARKKAETDKKNGGCYVAKRNIEDNVMKYKIHKDKMVNTRKSHPLGYHRGRNPFQDETLIQNTKKRMSENNPLSRPEVKEKRYNKTAQRYGFKSDIEFINFINDEINNGKTPTRISKELKCDKSTIFSRLPHNHKIVEIEKIGIVETWDLTVDIYHNFAVLSGIFIRNCGGHG